MSRMDKIIAVNEKDGDVVAQAGLGYESLNAELKKRGIKMFLPLDPGPNASIGGMIGTGCSGTNSVRYGTARAEWFLNVTAVLPDGTILKTRQRSRKSSTGPDMTKLFIGAEGTLGVITEVTIRLAPLLPTRVGVVAFPSVRHAVDAVVDILNDGVQVQCGESVHSPR
jgi:D-lactate dehydrogenase (cytochrome)